MVIDTLDDIEDDGGSGLDRHVGEDGIPFYSISKKASEYFGITPNRASSTALAAQSYSVSAGVTAGRIVGATLGISEVFGATIERYVRYAPPCNQQEIRDRAIAMLGEYRSRRTSFEKIGQWVYEARQACVKLGGRPPSIFDFKGPDGGYEFPPVGIFSSYEIMLIRDAAKRKGLKPTGCYEHVEPRREEAVVKSVQEPEDGGAAEADPDLGPAEDADSGDEGLAPSGFGVGL